MAASRVILNLVECPGNSGGCRVVGDYDGDDPDDRERMVENMKRTILGVLCAALVLMGTAVPASAGEDAPVLSRIVARGQINVGMTGSQPPFNVKAKDGTLMGYDVDLAELLADAMGVKLNIVIMKFDELLPALKAGKVDAVMSGVTMTPRRNLEAAFVGPYLVSGKAILTTDKALAAIAEAEDLDSAKLKVVALKGSTSQDFVEQAMSKVQLITVPDYDTGVAKVLDGSADAMVADYPILALTVLRNPGKGLVVSDKPLSIEPMGIALPAGDYLFVNMVQNYFTALDGIGVLDLLEKQWFENGSWLSELP